VVGAGPDAARVVAVVAVARDVVVLVLAAWRAVVLDAGAGVVAPGWTGAVVAVAAGSAVELVVVPGGPAMAKSPPFRKEGGPFWVSL
jgi:hypothetical protein